jgi:hypothetical protein
VDEIMDAYCKERNFGILSFGNLRSILDISLPLIEYQAVLAILGK